jgi:hypothetical protein
MISRLLHKHEKWQLIKPQMTSTKPERDLTTKKMAIEDSGHVMCVHT